MKTKCIPPGPISRTDHIDISTRSLDGVGRGVGTVGGMTGRTTFYGYRTDPENRPKRVVRQKGQKCRRRRVERTANRTRFDSDTFSGLLELKHKAVQCLARNRLWFDHAHYGGGLNPPPWVVFGANRTTSFS
jgi:hypothetical protein